MGGVFDEPVEAFDGVAQGGVAGVPGGAAVGQVLAVAGAGVGGVLTITKFPSQGPAAIR